MDLFDIIYTIIIGPLKLLFEVIYTLAYYMCSSPGLSIIALSLVMNFLVLPLYAKADKMQEEQNNIEKKLKRGVDHIKKTFKGDERYMMLQTYYRQNNYKPTDALKGSISLLLEVPFFMAAYAFLSNLNVLKHASFGPIVDLGAPDQMLSVFGITLNLLPILMTLINIISSYIYTKGLPAKAKVQLYVMAGLFLVLLYDSPAGLVFYWTLNNLFSLVKNIFYKLKNPKLVLSILSSLVSVIGLLFVIVKHPFTFNQTVLVVAVLLAMQLPLLLYLFKDKLKFKEREDKPADSKIFVLSTIALALLTGLLIPTQLINSSPTEFMNTVTMENPLVYVLSAFCLAFGTFVLWCNVFYNLLGGNKVKRILNYFIVVVLFVFVVDYFFFGDNAGQLSLYLRFNNSLYSETAFKIKNIIIVIFVSLVCLVLYKLKNKFVLILSEVLIIASIILSCVNIYGIGTVINQYKKSLNVNNNDDIVFNLSQDEENVVVFMMDRQIGELVPYIFNEVPGLKEKYAGFTFYPNTISYSNCTKSALPSVYGGYEYTPKEINERSKESLYDKVSESYKVLPMLFGENGFNVTITDVTSGIKDDIFDNLENVTYYNTIGSIQYDEYRGMYDQRLYERLKRNVFCYSIVRCVPTFFQQLFYNFGAYNDVDYYYELVEQENGYSRADHVLTSFMDNYQVLKALPELTNISKDNPKSFTMIYNLTAHDVAILQEPAFEPQRLIDNTDYDKEHEIRLPLFGGGELKISTREDAKTYECNAASLIQIGNYLDYLREEGVYDNTRVIIVADHGWEMDVSGDDPSMMYNPVLMVKDFNSKDFSVDNSFMTNADTPYLACKDIVNEAVNPITGNSLTDVNKKSDDIQHVLYTLEFLNIKSNEYTYSLENGAYWYSFFGNDALNQDNWLKDIK